MGAFFRHRRTQTFSAWSRAAASIFLPLLPPAGRPGALSPAVGAGDLGPHHPVGPVLVARDGALCDVRAMRV
jgi:hypothetical protein